MSIPDQALILPISDLSLNREENTKLRLAGTITGINPSNSSLIVLSDPHPAPTSTASSVLVDLSLCISNNSWRRRSDAKLPELKSKLMVIGHLTRRAVRVDLEWLTKPNKRDLGEVQRKDSVGEGKQCVPNGYFVLEAILCKPLDESFHLALWNHAARLRSQNEWSHYYDQHTRSKGKRKADT